jgi:hypothetical protein
MPTQSKPDNATPANGSGADAESGNVVSVANLAAFMGVETAPTESNSDSTTAVAEVENVPSHEDTESAAAEEAVSGQRSAEELAEAEVTEPDAPAEDGESEASEPEEGVEMPRRMRKRIDKLTAEKYALKAELDFLKSKQTEAKAELQSQGPSAPVVLPNQNPLHQVIDLRQLAAMEEQADSALGVVDNLLMDLEDNPEAVERQLQARKVELKDSDGQPDYSVNRMKRHLLEIRRDATTVIRSAPKQRQALQEEQQAGAAAAADFPWLANAESDERKHYDQVVKGPRAQLIRSLGPDHQYLAAVFAEGLKVLHARKGAKAKAVEVERKAPPLPPRSPGKPAARAQPQPGSAARNRVFESGNVDDLAAALPRGI